MIDKHLEAAAAAYQRETGAEEGCPGVDVEAIQAAITAYLASLASAGEEGLRRAASEASDHVYLTLDRDLPEALDAALAVARLSMSEDTARLDWFEQDAAEGGCSSLINDDAGRWAVSGDGMQNVPDGDEPSDISTCFYVEKHQWRNSVREAIDAARATEGGGHA